MEPLFLSLLSGDAQCGLLSVFIKGSEAPPEILVLEQLYFQVGREAMRKPKD
ncbi:hypothetical protein YC2023_099329 [Brassica napus]